MTTTPSDLNRRLWSEITQRPEQDFWLGPDSRHGYDDLANAIRTVSGRLADAGLTPGDRVLIASEDDWAALTLWMGALLNGNVPVLLAEDAGRRRIAGIRKQLKPKVILTDAARLGEGWAQPRRFATVFDAAQLPDATPVEPSLTAPKNDLAYVVFTSGSTSAPKGVRITHRNLAAQMETVADALKVDASSRILNSLVLYHADGLLQGPILTAWTGAVLLRTLPFHPSRAADDMEWAARNGATHLIGAPTLLQLLDRSLPKDDYFKRPEFVCVMSSSAALTPALWDHFEARFGVPIVNEYGMTETVAASHFAGDLPGLGARHTIGKPLGCKARILREDGSVAEPGEQGELVLKGDNIFDGYFGDPERTKAAFVDGWLRTGDLAIERPDGSHQIVGRIATTINTGGFLIQPEEIDEAALTHPDIRDARTVGMPHDVFGQIPVTAYVADSILPPATVMAHLRDNLEKRKAPKRVVQVDEIPRTGSGKPELPRLKKLLKKNEADALAGPDKAVLAKLLALAADVFGVAADTVHADSTPETTAGWDSYAHTALMLEIEDHWKIEIPTNDMMNVATLGDLAGVVQRLLGIEDVPDGYVVEEMRGGGDGGSIIVTPAVGGRTNFIGRLLPKLPEDHKVYGLSLSRALFVQVEDVSVPALGSAMADAIEAANLTGPITLIGYSYGGYIAFEVVSQLEKRGIAVRALVMMDTSLQLHLRRFYWAHQIRQGSRMAFKRLAAKVKTGSFRLRFDDTDRYLRSHDLGYLDLHIHPPKIRDRARRSFSAVNAYVPPRIAAPMLVIAAHWRYKTWVPVDDGLGWPRHTGGDVTTVRLGQHHSSIVSEDETALAATEVIRNYLRSL